MYTLVVYTLVMPSFSPSSAPLPPSPEPLSSPKAPFATPAPVGRSGHRLGWAGRASSKRLLLSTVLCFQMVGQRSTPHVAWGYDPDAPSPCFQIMDARARTRCLESAWGKTTRPSELSSQEFGREWDKVAGAIGELKCQTADRKALTKATNNVALAAVQVRISPTLDRRLVAQFQTRVEELINTVKRLTPPDKPQRIAIRAINRFKSKIV